MVTLMMSWRLNKSSSKVERRKRSWDKDEKIKWNYFIDSLDQFYSPGDFMRYPVIVHNYLLPLEQLFLSQPALHLQHAIQLISLSYSSFEAWQHGNISFFTALPLLLFPVNFPWQRHCPVQSQVCHLWMVWVGLVHALYCGEWANTNTSQMESDWQEILITVSEPNIPSLGVWVCSGGCFSLYKSLSAVKVWEIFGFLWGACAKTLTSTNPQDAVEGLNHDLWGCLFS